MGRFVDNVHLEYGKVDREYKYWSIGTLFGERDPEPSHWMPLPDAPAEPRP
jgi:hypothetical protein